MNTPNLTVRAGDVGYGHIIFTDGRDIETGALRTDSIPSQSPAYKGTIVAGGGGVMKRRDTFIVPVENRMYEVGREVHRALTGKQETGGPKRIRLSFWSWGRCIQSRVRLMRSWR